MFQPKLPASVADVHFDDPPFWSTPIEEREGAFALLRREQPMSFHQEFEPPPEFPLPRGPGYWAVTRHADVLTASRRSDLFCSGKGVQIPDLPGGDERVLRLDDRDGRPAPRPAARNRVARLHAARARPLAARRRAARAALIDAVIDQGECDFVTKIAAPLPLGIICDMMGIPESQTQFVFEQTNIILGLGDPEYVAPGANPIIAALTSGRALVELMNEIAAERRKNPKDDLTSQLLNASIDGADAHRPGARVVLRAAGRGRQRDHAQRDQPRHEGALRPSRRAAQVGGELRGRRAERRRGDRALGLAGDPLPAHRDARHGARRSEAARGREDRALVQLGEPRRGGLRRAVPLRRDAHARTSTSASAVPARTTVWARTWRGARSPACSASCSAASPTSRSAARRRCCSRTSSTASSACSAHGRQFDFARLRLAARAVGACGPARRRLRAGPSRKQRASEVERLAAELELGALEGRRLVAELDVLDHRVRRPAAQERERLLDACVVALDHRLDAAVGQVAHPAREPERAHAARGWRRGRTRPARGPTRGTCTRLIPPSEGEPEAAAASCEVALAHGRASNLRALAAMRVSAAPIAMAVPSRPSSSSRSAPG